MYWTLFLTFVKIGMFTIGGGYAMLPLIQRDVVDRGWMTKEDFIDVFSVAQSLPGIFAVNIAIFVGYKLKKTWGGFVCALGTILPSFVIMLLIALFFTQVKDNVWVEKAFMGLRPAVVALIAVPCLTTARSIKLSYVQMIIPVGAALLIWMGWVSPARKSNHSGPPRRLVSRITSHTRHQSPIYRSSDIHIIIATKSYQPFLFKPYTKPPAIAAKIIQAGDTPPIQISNAAPTGMIICTYSSRLSPQRPCG